jgi:molecular chaperone DnaK
VESCLVLAEEALAGARVNGQDMDRILLVGGPTQSPFVRTMLTTRLGAQVDFSVDPMTVVGRGAALYASTLERTNASVPPRTAACLQLKLAYEPVSAEAECIVAGRVANDKQGLEIKIESEGGLWTSGWMKLREGTFETSVSLKTGGVTTFWVYARDEKGQLLETDTQEFVIRHGLVPSAPPLPHALSVEILTSAGQPALDPVFSKGTPLPTEKTVKYRATHALMPGKPDSGIAIKLWEGEYLNDPDANEWVGNVLLSHDGVKRSVPEGAEIEVTIQVSPSRLITVEAFVPHLNQHFSGRLFVPQREEQDFAQLSRTVVSETEMYRTRLEEIESTLSDAEDESTKRQVEEVRRSLDALDAKSSSTRDVSRSLDPDDARRIVEESKNVRGGLGRLERRVADKGVRLDASQFVDVIERTTEVVTHFGSALDKQQFAMLRREFDRSIAKGDEKIVQRVCAEISGLRWRILYKQDWFWREILDSLKKPGVAFVDKAEASSLIAQGQAAVENGNGDALRQAVRGLWQLQPKGLAEAARERVVRSGLRKY